MSTDFASLLQPRDFPFLRQALAGGGIEPNRYTLPELIRTAGRAGLTLEITADLCGMAGEDFSAWLAANPDCEEGWIQGHAEAVARALRHLHWDGAKSPTNVAGMTAWLIVAGDFDERTRDLLAGDGSHVVPAAPEATS